MRGDRPVARQYAGRLAHAPQSFLENFIQIDPACWDPVAAGNLDSPSLGAARLPLLPAEVKIRHRETGPRTRLLLIIGPRRAVRLHCAIPLRGDELRRIEVARIHELDSGQQFTPVERLVERRQCRRVDG